MSGSGFGSPQHSGEPVRPAPAGAPPDAAAPLRPASPPPVPPPYAAPSATYAPPSAPFTAPSEPFSAAPEPYSAPVPPAPASPAAQPPTYGYAPPATYPPPQQFGPPAPPAAPPSAPPGHAGRPGQAGQTGQVWNGDLPPGEGQPGPTGLGVLVDPGGPGAMVTDGATRRSRTPAEQTGPARRVVMGALAGAVVGGSLLGLVVGVLAPPGPPQTTVNAAAVGTKASSTASAAAAAAPAATRSPSPSASKTAPVKTVRQTELAPPGVFIEQPWTDASAQFVQLDDIWREDDEVVLKVTPMTFLTGARARAYYEQAGQEAREFAAVPKEGQSAQLRVRGDATVYGEFFLGDHSEKNRQEFSTNDLYDDARSALDHDRKPTFWIKRSLGIEGPVIYVAEQYLD